MMISTILSLKLQLETTAFILAIKTIPQLLQNFSYETFLSLFSVQYLQ